jgi:hypothetical protein
LRDPRLRTVSSVRSEQGKRKHTIDFHKLLIVNFFMVPLILIEVVYAGLDATLRLSLGLVDLADEIAKSVKGQSVKEAGHEW